MNHSEEQSVIEEPINAQEDKIVQSTTQLSLEEQLSIMTSVHDYLLEYEPEKMQQDTSWEKGFQLLSEVFVREEEENIYRTNMEVFFQDVGTANKKVSYLVSLIKFGEERWQVFRVIEKNRIQDSLNDLNVK